MNLMRYLFLVNFHLVDGIWTYVNNIYSESLINMLLESLLYSVEVNLDLRQCSKNCRDVEFLGQ